MKSCKYSRRLFWKNTLITSELNSTINQSVNNAMWLIELSPGEIQIKSSINFLLRAQSRQQYKSDDETSSSSSYIPFKYVEYLIFRRNIV